MYALSKVARILGCCVEEHLPLSSFAFDSRKVEKGALFFALEGKRADGHDFLEEVREKGGYAAVVSKQYSGKDYGLVLLRVDDVEKSLHDLARSVLQERKTRVIGVTGSVGKTTTKEFIATILEGKYRVGKNPGSYNSQVTLPFVILNARGDEEIFVLEMGMSEVGNIRKLAAIAPPEIVVITPIGLAHAENFENVEEIARAKAEIFTPECQFAVIHAKSISLKPIYESCMVENVIYPGKETKNSPFSEHHLTENYLAAREVALHLGMTEEEIAENAKRLRVSHHRFEKKMIRKITVIDDSYNANPTSMFAALANLPKPERRGKTIAVLGSMKELGKFSYLSHQQVGEEALKKVDTLYCIGQECQPMVELFSKAGKPVEIFSDYQLLKKVVRDSANPGDVVLIKGSNSHKLWEVVDSMREDI